MLAAAAAEPEVAVNRGEAERLAELPPIFPVEVKRRSVQSCGYANVLYKYIRNILTTYIGIDANANWLFGRPR